MIHMDEEEIYSDELLAAELDAVARVMQHTIRLCRQASARQIGLILESSPFGETQESASDIAVDMVTWAVVAAATLRGLDDVDLSA